MYGDMFKGLFTALVLFGLVIGALLMWLLPKLWHWLVPLIHAWSAP